MAKSYHLAIDIGASSGRLMLCRFEPNKPLVLQEVYRFSNSFVQKEGYDCWDTHHLFTEILQGLALVKQQGIEECSLSIDTWGVDYVCLNKEDRLIGQAIAYRDKRTQGVMERVTQTYGYEKIYQKTGIQFLPFNTLYQLMTEPKEKLEQTATLLLIADYLTFLLTGIKVCEYSNATTTQMFNCNTMMFDNDLLSLAGVRSEQFAKIVWPGTVMGFLNEELANNPLYPHCKVIATASHDTASAVLGFPLQKNQAFLSSGTWSLLGCELLSPLVSHQARVKGFTNEGGAFGTIRFLKNIMGLWLIQRLQNEYNSYSFKELIDLAKEEEGFLCLINVNSPRFLNPPNMRQAIEDFCQETSQNSPKTVGKMVRCILDSLALSYKRTMDELEACCGFHFDQLLIGGGGVYNDLLNQITANVLQKTVLTTSPEVTALGNLGVQLITCGHFKNLEEFRTWIRSSFLLQKFESQKIENYENILILYKEIEQNE